MTRARSDLEEAIAAWRRMDGPTAEARLWPLSMLMVDVYAAALLLEQAGLESASGASRKALIAELYVRSHLSVDRMRGLTEPPRELERFKELVDGALTDTRV